MRELEGRVAIVTGAGRGIGREHALLLARRGASVVVNDLGCEMDGTGVDPGPASSVAAEITAAGGRAVAQHGDVADPDHAQAVVDTAIGEFGRLDIVINNAGVLTPGTFADTKRDQFTRVLGVHLHGTAWICLAAWPHLRQAQHPRIVNTNSSAMFGIADNSSYAAAKGGIFGLTRALALEGTADGVKVNCLAPAAWTRMAVASAGSDLMTPEAWAAAEAAMPPRANAAVAAFLAHETCDLTGEVLSYSGGRLARWVLTETEGIMVSPDLTPEAVAYGLDEVLALNDQHRFTSTEQLFGYTQAKLMNG